MKAVLVLVAVFACTIDLATETVNFVAKHHKIMLPPRMSQMHATVGQGVSNKLVAVRTKFKSEISLVVHE